MNIRRCLCLLGLLCLRGSFFRRSILRIQLRLDLLRIQAAEQHLCLSRHLIARRIKTKARHSLEVPLLRVELLQNLLGSLRHETEEQRCSDGQRLGQVVKHSLQSVLLCLVFCECPGQSLVDILVAALEDIPEFRHRIGNAEHIHLLPYLLDLGEDSLRKLCVERPLLLGEHGCRLLDHAAEILIGHCNRAAHKVSEHICEIGIVALYHEIPADAAVVLERHLVQTEITHRIHTEKGNQVIGIEHIALGLRHLAASL